MATVVNGWTDQNGRFEIMYVPGGQYYARTRQTGDPWVDEWYNNVPVTPDTSWRPPDNAQLLDVPTGGTLANIDFSLGAGTPDGALGTFAGRIEDPAGVPIDNAIVQLYVQDGGMTDYWFWSDPLGMYSGQAPAGQYYVVARAPEDSPWLDTWYDAIVPPHNAGIPVGAQRVTIPPNDTLSGVDFTLPEGTSLSGNVTDGSGAPWGGVEIAVVDANNRWVGGAHTDAKGDFSAIIPGGTCYLRANPENDSGLLDQWYDGVAVANGSIPPAAAELTVTPGAHRTGLDFVLGAGARLFGTVDDGSGGPIGDVEVEVYNASGGHQAWADTDALGRYDVTVNPGTYVLVSTPEAESGFLAEWYNDIPAAPAIPPGVEQLTVGAGQSREANFHLASANTGGRISGRLTGDSGRPIADARVWVYSDSGQPLSSTTTGDDGSYQTAPLLPGSYHVCTQARPLHFIDEWYNDTIVSDQEPATGATPVTVVAGATTDNIDFQLGSVGVTYVNCHTGQLHMRWKARAGVTYRIERATSLDGAWTLAFSGTNPDEKPTRTPTADGEEEYHCLTPISGRAYYRVVAVEPTSQ